MPLRKIVLFVISSLALMIMTLSGSYLNGYADENLPLAVTLVIDRSGSMKETDPQLLRETASQMFVDLLGEGDYISVLGFDHEVQVIQSMIRINDKSTKSLVKGNIEGKLVPKGDTDYVAAFRMAKVQQMAFSSDEVKKIIIFMTDGNPDPDPDRLHEEGFMDRYLSELSGELSEIRADGVHVYSIGFGAIDTSILDRISMETEGESKVLETPGDLALEFFQILSVQKGRSNFIVNEIDLPVGQSVEFTVEEYIKLTSLVIISDSSDLSVDIIPPDGVEFSQAGSLNRMPRYTFLEIAQNENEFTGLWQLKLEGTGRVKLFGDKDLAIKLKIIEPGTGSIHTVNESLHVITEIFGVLDESMTVQAEVYVDGIPSLHPIYLKGQDGLYEGEIKDTKNPGKYEVRVFVSQNGKVVSSAKSSFYIKLVPSISTDFLKSEKGYYMGHELSVSSSLKLLLSNLTPSSGITLESFTLKLLHENDTILEYPLSDDGLFENGDFKQGDGIFSRKIILDELGEFELLLMARGEYQGELFILERVIEDSFVYGPGVVKVWTSEKLMVVKPGKWIMVPVHVENKSQYTEVLTVTIDEPIGETRAIPLVIKPGAKETLDIPLRINGEIEDNLKIILKFDAENDYTMVEGQVIHLGITELSGRDLLMKNFDGISSVLWFVIGGLISVFLLTFIAGTLVYRKNVLPLNNIGGLLRLKSLSGESKVNIEEITLDLSLLKKSVARIAMTSSGDSGDFIIDGKGKGNDFEVVSRILNNGPKFILGITWLLGTIEREQLIKVNTGALIYNNDAHKTLKLTDGMMFETGGLTFLFTSDDKEGDDGVNVLDGKYGV